MTFGSNTTATPIFATALGIGTFAAMDAFMKALAIDIGAYNAILWRTCAALCICGTAFLALRIRWPAPAILRIHIWRSLVVSLMAFLFFWGLRYVPLAEAIALSFIAPLIALYLAAVMLGEQIGRKAIGASLLGFAGALVIVSGRFNEAITTELGPGIGAILLSAVLYAYNLILQRRQALLAGPVEIATFQNGTILLVYACFSPWFAVVPKADHLPLIGGAALLSLTSLMLMAWAYARAQAKSLVSVEYTAFAWAALWGWLFFAEAVTATTVAGTGLIILGCLLALREPESPPVHTETTSL
ncbi:MAG: DMT family transporter [Pseudomonadota bacterium]